MHVQYSVVSLNVAASLGKSVVGWGGEWLHGCGEDIETPIK